MELIDKKLDYFIFLLPPFRLTSYSLKLLAAAIHMFDGYVVGYITAATRLCSAASVDVLRR